MEASVQYNDFLGTSAADISDFASLDDYLNSKGVDTNRYNAQGAKFYAGYSDSFSVAIICEDNERSTEANKYIVSISFENDITKDEFFDLFKRFEVIVIRRNSDIENCEISEEITIDDRAE